MADEFGNSGGLDEEEEVEKIDPATLAPDLWQAIKANDNTKILQLIEESVPPTHEDETSGWNCVNWAAYHGNGKILKKVLELNGATSYHAFKKEQRESAKSEFLKDVTLTKTVTSTPLMWAVFHGKQRCVWLLLLEGYSPDDADEKGNGCLHLAAGSGHIGILQALINDGANPFLLNKYKNSPLDVALNSKCKEMIQAAMEKYDPNTVEKMHADNVEFVSMMMSAYFPLRFDVYVIHILIFSDENLYIYIVHEKIGSVGRHYNFGFTE
jgi:ankyrin repeat protein